VLLIDTQLSAFWNQHPSRQLSIFAHNLPFPCPKSHWEALTPTQWLRLRISPPFPTSLPSHPPRLKSTTTPRVKPLSSSGFLPGLHPEFQVSVVSEGYSSSVLSALAAESLEFEVGLENGLGVEMVLMGLLAIAWDCRTRGGMGIRFRDGTTHWRGIVLNGEW
jgi:hypothetical protein